MSTTAGDADRCAVLASSQAKRIAAEADLRADGQVEDPAASGMVTAMATSAVTAESASSDRQTLAVRNVSGTHRAKSDEQHGEDVERADVPERQRRADALPAVRRAVLAVATSVHGLDLRGRVDGSACRGPRLSMTRRSSVSSGPATSAHAAPSRRTSTRSQSEASSAVSDEDDQDGRARPPRRRATSS